MNVRSLITLLLLSAALFGGLQFSYSNLQQDDFYHIGLADLMKRQGLIAEFPALEHTVLNKRFVDNHFLYHVLLIPFTLGDPLTGGKVSAVLFIMALAAVFYGFLRRYGIRYPFFWTALFLFTSQGLMIRLLAVRPISLSIIGYLAAVHCLFQRKPIALTALSFVFVWFYVMFPVLLAIILIFSTLDFAYRRKIDYRLLAAGIGGTAAGLVINPYFPKNLKIFLLQYTSGSLSRPDLEPNLEWLPVTTWDLVQTGWPMLLALGVVFFLALAKPKAQDFQTLFLFVLSCFFFGFFCKAGRAIDQFTPFIVLFSAFAFSRLSPDLGRPLKGAAIAALCLAAALNVFQAHLVLKGMEPIDNRGAGQWLKENAADGANVFNVNYGAFPQLFYFSPKQHYATGLDPNFMKQLDDRLYEQFVDVIRLRKDPYPILKNVFRSEYLHIEFLPRSKPLLDYLFRRPDQFESVYQDGFAAVFKVR